MAKSKKVVKKAAPKKAAPKKLPKPKSTRVTRPVPVMPAPPPAPAKRDEWPPAKDVGRLIRYGEKFGALKIETKMREQPLPITSGAIAIFDPADKKSWKVIDRPIGVGQFRSMVSVIGDRTIAITVHCGRPPIDHWAVAHYKGKKPKSADEASVASSTGWIAICEATGGSPGVLALPDAKGAAITEVPLTDGRKALAIPCAKSDISAYWAVDATDKPICFVIDCDALTQKDWKAKPV
ncbi:MAG: hypothetical protein QM831_16785 [Kofleriaceae bacterium]